MVNTGTCYVDSSYTSCGLSAGAIAGIVIGCVAGVAIIIGIIVYCIWKKKKDAQKTQM
jgi:hypothetical protein